MAKQLLFAVLFACFFQEVYAQVPKLIYLTPNVEYPAVFPTDPEGNNSNDAGVNALFESYGVYFYRKAFKYMKSESLRNQYMIQLSGDADNLAAQLTATGKFNNIATVEYAQLNNCTNPVTVNDSLVVNNIINEWYSANWALEAIDAACAWTVTTGAGMSVAVVDTEFDTLHEDLNGKLARTWGMSTGASSSACEPAHGTKVSGIITARTNNHTGIASVGYDMKVNGYSVIAMDQNSCDILPSYGLEQALIDKNKVINLSMSRLGSINDAALAKEITDSGAVLVLSAGNSPHVKQHYAYANIPGVIKVSSAYPGGDYYWNHARSPYVDVCAPGYSVATTNVNNTYHYSTGTSIAAPIVTAIAGLVFSVNPCLTPGEVEHIIKSTTVPLPNAHLFPDSVGTGMVNAYNAVLLASDYQHTISTDTTWTGLQRYGGNIVVEQGATLTLTDTLLMGCDNTILVKKGGKLVIDGAYISTLSYNETGFWQGIRVEGTAGQRQNVMNSSSTVIIKNGAVIENALIAVANWDTETGVHTAGGVIQATDAVFRNNKKSLDFVPFFNYDQNHNIRPDLSYFRRCEFTITDEYNGNATTNPFDCHASLWEVNGVSFTGCRFYNRNTSSMKGRGHGLLSFNAGYTVGPYCSGIYTLSCSDIQRSIFKGFTYGIKADGDYTGAAYALTVDRCDFDSVAAGIDVAHFNHLSALRNRFYVGNHRISPSPIGCHRNIGIYARYISQFRIEENEFTGFPYSGWEHIGVVVQQSGPDDKELYKNRFEQLSKGVWVLGKNVSNPVYPPGNPSGLRLVCNQFQDNTKDIFVEGNPAAPYREGICQYQGSSLKSAGNLFLSATVPHISNGAMNLSYWYNGSNTEPVNGFGFSAGPAAAAHGCASRFTTDVPSVLLDATAASVQSAAFATHTGLFEAAYPEFEALIDDGDQAGLLAYIGTAEPEDAAEVTNTMLQKAPWLSETVLHALVTAGILPTGMLMDVLVEHPDVLRHYDFMGYIRSLEYIGPEEEALLEAALSVNTERTEALSKLTAYHSDASTAANMMVTSIKNDSLGNTAELLPQWLNHTGTLWAQYQLAFYYIDVDDINAGAGILEAIPDEWELEGGLLEEHDAFVSLWDIRKELQSSGRHIRQLTDPEKTTLEGIRETLSGTMIGSISHSVLNFVNNIPDSSCAALTPPVYSRQAGPPGRPAAIRATLPLIHAYPNPAKDYTTFAYNLATVKGRLVLSITNQAGQQVALLYPGGSKGRLHWDTRLLPAGTYVYRLSDDQAYKGSGKVVIIK